MKAGEEIDQAKRRWGGEEFVILLTDITYDQASKIAEKLREQLMQTRNAACRNGNRKSALQPIGVTIPLMI